MRSLNKVWGPYSRGLLGWLMTGDHKRIGKLQIITAFVFFLLGGLEAMLMRFQLIHAENRLLSSGSVRPDLHHAWHHHDVFVRRSRACRASALTSFP